MPPKAKAGGAKPKKKANGYKFPEKLPKGEVLVDLMKKEWVLGESIGQGGFGEIYYASERGSENKWSYAVKIEPHENGPLFVEKNFYMRVAKPDDVKSWKKKEGLNELGIPMYRSSGTHIKGTEKYRFIVIDRYGKDLMSLFVKSKSFPPHTVYKLALQIIEALRYIHSKGFTHGDIKGSNLMLGLAPGTENQVFLLDFGNACKYSEKEFKRDPDKAHNGTIEYTSCDMHMGVPTRRGDLEILGYNLLHWLSGSLPWEKDLSNCEAVHKKKRELMDNVESYVSSNFPNISKAVFEYMACVSKLKHDEEPNYKHIKDLFTKELKKIGSSVTGPLEFDAVDAKPTATKRAAGRKPATIDLSDDEAEDTLPKVPARGRAANKPKAAAAAKPTAPKRAAARKPATFDLSDDDAEDTLPKVPARGRAANKPKAAAAAKPTTPKRAAARKPALSDLSDDEAEDTLPKVPARGRAANKPKTTAAGVAAAAAKPTTSKRAAARKPAHSDLSDEDMFDSEGSEATDENDDSPKPKNTRPAKKAVANGDSKPSRSTKRSAPKSSSNGSPNKKTKTASKKTKAPAPKKLDYRDAPKCLLPAIREEK